MYNPIAALGVLVAVLVNDLAERFTASETLHPFDVVIRAAAVPMRGR
jgi:hypothetical protein